MKQKAWVYVLLGAVLGAILCGVGARSLYSFKLRGEFFSDVHSWQKLYYILDLAERNYVDTLDKSAVTDAALQAALQALDPHSVYMVPRELKSSEENLAGKFEGIGIQFNVPNDTAVVLSVIPGGPSEKAGLMVGDRILKVDSRDIAGVGMAQDTMVSLMRGPKDSRVCITVGRDGEYIPFDIVRDKIPEYSVAAAFMLDDHAAYMRISKFSHDTYEEFREWADKFMAGGMKALVIDLRGNTGGFLDQACYIANEFLPDGAQIVYTEGLHRERQDIKADGRGVLRDVRVSVLIDDGSASASEILAGAIQDNDRGAVVGRRSFGKGVVQEPFYLTDGSGIRLTVARYYTPSGRCIQKPVTDTYAYDFYERYQSGELSSADSIKVDENQAYKTVGGRTVYGGGGIIPDVFVPLDTTRATNFHLECNRKAVPVRFATRFFDAHRSAMSAFSDFKKVKAYVEACPIESDFLSYAATFGLTPADGEWERTRDFLLPQVKGLCARYSKVGEEAYYRYTLPIDNEIGAAIRAADDPSFQNSL